VRKRALASFSKRLLVVINVYSLLIVKKKPSEIVAGIFVSINLGNLRTNLGTWGLGDSTAQKWPPKASLLSHEKLIV